MYREQGNYRAGLYQEIWTENSQPVGFGATREDGEDRDKAGLWCQGQLRCHQVYQGKMLEAIAWAAEHEHGYGRTPSLSCSVWVPYSEQHGCHLAPLRRVCRRHKDVPSALNKRHRSCVSRMENPIFQRRSGSLLTVNCGEICFYWAFFCFLETKT